MRAAGMKEAEQIQISPLTVVCPDCGSADVAYSCVPDCCFNHVCGGCLNSFELSTEATGETMTSVEAPAIERDSNQPTVACAKCQSLEVYQLAQGAASGLVCTSCHSLLTLRFSTI